MTPAFSKGPHSCCSCNVLGDKEGRCLHAGTGTGRTSSGSGARVGLRQGGLGRKITVTGSRPRVPRECHAEESAVIPEPSIRMGTQQARCRGTSEWPRTQVPICWEPGAGGTQTGQGCLPEPGSLMWLSGQPSMASRGSVDTSLTPGLFPAAPSALPALAMSPVCSQLSPGAASAQHTCPLRLGFCPLSGPGSLCSQSRAPAGSAISSHSPPDPTRTPMPRPPGVLLGCHPGQLWFPSRCAPNPGRVREGTCRWTGALRLCCWSISGPATLSTSVRPVVAQEGVSSPELVPGVGSGRGEVLWLGQGAAGKKGCPGAGRDWGVPWGRPVRPTQRKHLVGNQSNV